ncbi:MAG: hypothetical protein ACJ8D4_06165 [Xanthobacteraceae bacterium]
MRDPASTVTNRNRAQGESMADRPPHTDKWMARENKHNEGLVLILDGVVQVANTNQEPRLTEPATVARPPKTLVLDLTVESSGDPGSDVPVWKPAHFHKDVQANQFADVSIRWDGKPIASANILDDSEYDQHLTRMTRAANIEHAPARGPAKKISAKKKAAKKKVAKKVAKKKVAKKKVAKKRVAKKRVTSAKRAGASRKKRASAKKRVASRRRR